MARGLFFPYPRGVIGFFPLSLCLGTCFPSAVTRVKARGPYQFPQKASRPWGLKLAHPSVPEPCPRYPSGCSLLECRRSRTYCFSLNYSYYMLGTNVYALNIVGTKEGCILRCMCVCVCVMYTPNMFRIHFYTFVNMQKGCMNWRVVVQPEYRCLLHFHYYIYSVTLK